MVGGFCNTITDYSTASGTMPMWFAIRDCIPMAFEALLFGIFLILFAGQYFLIKNRTGRAKILVALLSSGFIMLPLSVMLALGQLVQYGTVLLYAFIIIVVFILFLLSDNN